MDAAVVNILNELVENNDVLPVRVSAVDMLQGKKNLTSRCPGVLAIAAALGADLSEIRIQVGHKTKAHLSDRVLIKAAVNPDTKWIGWIINSPGKSGFHPQRFDQGKQKLPGAMMIEKWSKEPVVPMSEDKKGILHSPNARQQHLEYLTTTPQNGNYRVYNG